MVTRWHTIIDGLKDNVALLQEFGIHSLEMDVALLRQLQRPVSQPRTSEPTAAIPTPGTAPAGARCNQCSLATQRAHPPLSGKGNTRQPEIMFVAELPLSPPDLELLHKMIQAMQYHPDELYITSICKCSPAKNHTAQADDRRACMGALSREIKTVNPKVIVLLGETTTKEMFAAAPHLTPLLNQWVEVKKRQIIAIRTPAYLRRFTAAKHETWQTLQMVLRHLGRKLRM